MRRLLELGVEALWRRHCRRRAAKLRREVEALRRRVERAEGLL